MTVTPDKTALVLLPDMVGRMSLRGVLRRAGFTRVLEAESATEALTTLAAERIAVVFTAWEVADDQGSDLIRSLRNRGVNHNLPVVLLDNGIPQQNVVLAVKAGAAGKLTLPTSAQAVLDVLARHHEGRSEDSGTPITAAVRSNP